MLQGTKIIRLRILVQILLAAIIAAIIAELVAIVIDGARQGIHRTRTGYINSP